MSKLQIKENVHIFKCPLCGSGMRMHDEKSIVCAKNHCFDLSRRGYINMLTSTAKTDYDRPLLDSRNHIIKDGFFDPLTEKLAGLIQDHALKTAAGKITVLDAGCGEGSHLARVIKRIKLRTGRRITGVGIDISKEGIHIASRDYPGTAWCVADLAKVPFKDGTFNFILNILSPANYAEFKRLLTDDGVLIKVVPGSGYLAELREFFYQFTGKEEYSNQRIVKHFAESFNMTGTHRILYDMPVDRDTLQHLVRMTPLSWRAADERINKVLRTGISDITIDLTVILGINRKKVAHH